MVEVRDPDALAREIDRLKAQQLDQTRRAGAAGVEPMSAWTRRMKDEIAPALAGTRAVAEQARQMRPLVMVVEDDEFARQLLTRTIDATAYELCFVGDATGALSQLRRVRPDAILMDIGLPDLDGVSLTQRLKTSPHLADIPVIMMTGDARRETLVSSVGVGAAAFLVKPFTREVVESKLAKVLPR